MKQSRPRRRTLAARLIGIGVVLAMTAIGVAPASAAGDGTTLIAFDPSKKTVTFGDDWTMPVKVTNNTCRLYDCREALTVTFTGDNGATKTATVGLYNPYTGNKPADGSISSYDFNTPLAAGTYVVSAKVQKFVRRDRDHPYRSPGATIVVAPAPLSVDLRVESDATQPAGAVVSARLDGKYIEEFNRCLGYKDCHSAPPSGRWDFVVADESGATVVEKSISVTAEESQFVSFYWHEVRAGSNFSTTGTFTPSKADRDSFAIQPAGDVSFTSPDATETETPTTPVVVPEVEKVERGSTVPLWVAASWILVLLVLVVTIVIFGVLIARQSRAQKKAAPVTVAQGELE